MNSAFMQARHIVCDRLRVRGDKRPVVPTWFFLGPGWQVQQQGAARQQQKQPQKQQAKVQAGKKGNPDVQCCQPQGRPLMPHSTNPTPPHACGHTSQQHNHKARLPACTQNTVLNSPSPLVVVTTRHSALAGVQQRCTQHAM